MLIAFNPNWRDACRVCEHVRHTIWSAPQHDIAGVSWHCNGPVAGRDVHIRGDERACSHMRAPGMPCGPEAKLQKVGVTT